MTIGQKVLRMAACAVFLVSAVVRAQEEVPSKPDTDPVQFSIGVGGAYLDNRDTSEPEKESTFDFYVRPRIDLIGDWDRSRADLYYAPAYRYRTDPSDLQDENELYQDLGLLLNHELTRSVKVRLAENFNYTDDPSVSQDGTTLRRDSSFYMNRLAGGVTYQFNARTDADLNGFYGIKRYTEDEVATESDVDQYGAGLQARRQMTRSVTALAMGGLRYYDFESSELDRSSTVLMGLVGLDSILSPNLRIGARVGLQAAEYGDSSIDSETLPYLNGYIKSSPSPRTRLTAEATYQIRESDVYPFVTQEATDLFAGVQWDATEVVMLGLNGTYRLSQYDEDGIPSDFDGERTSGDETSMIGTAEIGFNLASDTTLKLTHRIEDIDSDVAESYTANTTSVMLTRKF